jgi:hypothetical protein
MLLGIICCAVGLEAVYSAGDGLHLNSRHFARLNEESASLGSGWFGGPWAPTLVQEVPQLAGARLVVLELAQGFVLDLADALAGYPEVGAHLLQGMLAPVNQALA